MPSGRLLLVAGIISAFLVAVVLWLYPSRTDYAVTNPYWNGLRRTGEQLGLQPLASLDLLADQARGTALIVIPYVSPSKVEFERLKRYVETGGVLLLMDDSGTANDVLTHLGVGARLSGQLLVDPLFNFKNGRLPRIADFTGGPITEGVESLVFNHATVIADIGRLTEVASSSLVSYLDSNQNGRRDADDPAGPFAVAAAGPVGEGYLVLVSDPSILLNSMLDLGHNRRFVRNLLRIAGADARIYLDEAHLPRAALDVAKNLLAQIRQMVALPPVAFALVFLGFGLPLAMVLKSSRR